MLQFFRILFLNAWNGVRRANVLPAFILTLMSVSVLLIGSSAAASGSNGDNPSSSNQVTTSQSPSPFVLGDENSTPPVQPKTHTKDQKTVNKPVNSQPQPPVSSSNQPSSQPSSEQPQTGQTAPAAPVLTLSSLQSVCTNGLTSLTVTSATLSLPAPSTTSGTLGWYWEVSGSNPSSSQINTSPNSENVAAGVSQIVFPAAASQPLLTAPSIQAAYSVRLHVLYGSQQAISNWITIPPVSASTCAQN